MDSTVIKAHSQRNSIWFLLFFSLLATLPVWLSLYPPMSDMPQHAAQVALLRNLHHPDFAYASQYRIHWFTPYLFGYMLVYLLVPLTGIVIAFKSVIALLLIAIPLSTALLLRQLKTDVFWSILTIPGLYGFAFQWGFLNFLVAVPIGLLFFWYILRHSEGTTPKTALLVAVFANGLFFCHALVCAFFLSIAGSYVLVCVRPLKKAALLILSMSSVVLVAGLWTWQTMSNPAARRPMFWDENWLDTTEPYYSGISSGTGIFHQGWGRLTGFFPRLLGMHMVLPSLLIGLAIFALPFLAGVRVRRRFANWLPFLVCLGILFFLPANIFGTDFVYQRFAIFALPLFLVTLKTVDLSSARTRLFQAAALLLVAGCIANVSAHTLAFNSRAKGFQEILARMQPGQRVLSMMFDHDDDQSIAPIFLHLPCWYAAEKAGVVDPSTAMMHPELVVYRDGYQPEAVLWDFEWDPGEFKWDEYDGGIYRYFVVRSVEDISPTYFASAPCKVVQRYHSGEWWLYEREDNCKSSSTASSR
jgi:hypothetical protein